MPKATTPTSAHSRRHNPLEDDILATGPLRQKAPKRKSRANNEYEDHYVDSKASRSILSLGRELAEEEAALPNAPAPEAAANPYSFDSRFPDDEQDYVNPNGDDDDAWGDEEEEIDEIEIEPQDLNTFRKFLPEGEEDDLLKYGWGGERPENEEPHGQTVNLADLILAKIQEHEMKMERKAPDFGDPDEEYELPEKVIEAFTRVGQFLSRYKSGKLPKLFKILPTTPNWEQIIEVTKPSEWTPNAVYEATKIFVSGNRDVAAAFLELVLLDRVRDDIYEHKKLNVHLFNAMKKGLYHPGSFFKGFLFPLVGSGTCTLKEAAIVCGVLSRHKIPVLYSAVALQKLCEFAAEEASQGTELSGATNLFIKTLLEKKYALPYQVIDSLVFHFLRFRSMDPASIKTTADMEEIDSKGNIRAKLPVIWHKSLLSFAERYRNDITEDQREALLDLLQTHGHYAIAPEVRRQLIAGRPRGVAVEPQRAALDGDDTMLIDG